MTYKIRFYVFGTRKDIRKIKRKMKMEDIKVYGTEYDEDGAYLTVDQNALYDYLIRNVD